MGRKLGFSYKPTTMGAFTVDENYVDKYYSYVFKIKACFGESDVSNLTFLKDSGISVKSIAFIKEKDFL